VTEARERIAWAADVPLDEALRLWPQLSPSVGVVKVGLSLFVEHGPAAVRSFRDQGAAVFLDLKLHDIPHTVEGAATAAGGLGATFLTVHASGGEEMIRAAVRGAARGAERAGVPPPRILAVTELTSISAAEVTALGFGRSAAEMTARLAAGEREAGAGGLVCSAQEAAEMSRRFRISSTPGIRPGRGAGDQARVETPAAAIRARASWSSEGRCTLRPTRRQRRARCTTRWLQRFAESPVGGEGRAGFGTSSAAPLMAPGRSQVSEGFEALIPNRTACATPHAPTSLRRPSARRTRPSGFPSVFGNHFGT
jgi:orotidine-5'-phosphate decarboxylase